MYRLSVLFAAVAAFSCDPANPSEEGDGGVALACGDTRPEPRPGECRSPLLDWHGEDSCAPRECDGEIEHNAFGATCYSPSGDVRWSVGEGADGRVAWIATDNGAIEIVCCAGEDRGRIARHPDKRFFCVCLTEPCEGCPSADAAVCDD